MSAPNADPAAIVGAIVSLYAACQREVENCAGLDLSGAYNGGDQFMREVHRVATGFELWACEHVNFDGTFDCWPYLLEERFGDVVLEIVAADELAGFKDWPAIAAKLELPLNPAPAEVQP